MHISRRGFVRASTLAGGVAAAPFDMTASAQAGSAVRALRPLPNAPPPISDEERRARIEKARRLMADQGMGALVLEPGASMRYFVNVEWGLSERPFLLVIPAKGDLAYVAPGFEENRAREITKFTNHVRVWQEDEDPAAVVAAVLRDRGVTTGKVGVEERVRLFIFDALRKAAPAVEWILATPVTAGCRMIKSPAEIALLQRANDITLAAFKAGLATVHGGMTPGALADTIVAAYTALGAAGDVAVSFGEYTAFPHGSIKPQRLREGDVVQIDDGVNYGGYQADITRTTVFGKPSARQTEIWNLEKAAQGAAFAAAQIGATCESVDAAARKVIADAGLGPGYKVPGLPHRTGHGIGLEFHEWTYLVRGNKTKLAAGMCFSDEPMIAIYGEFGIRLEDCFHMTEGGPKFFTPQSPSIDRPFPT